MARRKRVSTDSSRTLAARLALLVNEKKQQGLTHNEIAAGIGIASGSLSAYCHDQKSPTVDTLSLIAKYFEVPSDYLLGITDRRTSTPKRYTVVVTSKHTVDVEAYSPEEAIDKACEIAWEYDADESNGEIVFEEEID